jgi:hypothetical protein
MISSSPRRLHRRDDVRVRAAAAEIPAHGLAHLVVRPRVPLLEQRDGAHDLARGAVAALEGVVRQERRLHRVQRVAVREALDRGDLRALERDGEEQARIDAPPVHEDGAGAALSVIAPLLRAGEPHPLAKRVEEAHARVDADGALGAVDHQLHVDLTRDAGACPDPSGGERRARPVEEGEREPRAEARHDPLPPRHEERRARAMRGERARRAVQRADERPREPASFRVGRVARKADDAVLVEEEDGRARRATGRADAEQVSDVRHLPRRDVPFPRDDLHLVVGADAPRAAGREHEERGAESPQLRPERVHGARVLALERPARGEGEHRWLAQQARQRQRRARDVEVGRGGTLARERGSALHGGEPPGPEYVGIGEPPRHAGSGDAAM